MTERRVWYDDRLVRPKTRSAHWYQLGNREKGLCRLCPTPRQPGSVAYCAVHLERNRLRMRTLRGSRPWTLRLQGRPPLSTRLRKEFV